MNLNFKFFVLLFCALASSAFAVKFYGNGSDIKWKTASTDHFNFIYPGEYSDHAAEVSTYAEAVYDSIVSRYRIDLPRRVNVSLNNALYSNGSAIPSENALNLWLTNWDFKTRSSHGWLADVVTHEFSHLVSIENGSKMLPSLFGFQISYIDYYNERITSDFTTMYPFTLQPLWLAEGTAQFESSRMGFDTWDAHRDMLLRIAALNDDLLPLEYMHEFSENSLLAELGPYTQGFSLVRYIAKEYGENVIPKIWSELSRFHRVTLDGAFKEVLGIGEKELYQKWKEAITEEYKAVRDSLGALVEGSKITADAFWLDFPVVAGDYIYGVSNFGGLWFDGGIFKMPKSLTNLGDEESAEDGLYIESFEGTVDITEYTDKKFKLEKSWLDKGFDVFDDPDRGPILAYVTYQNRDKNGRAHFDIALVDTNKNELNITHTADAIYPTFDKQGTNVLFVRRENSSTRFALSKVPFAKDFKEYFADEPLDVFIPEASRKYYNIYSPKYSPNGAKIAFGFFDDTTRGIAVIDSNGKNYKVVSTPGFDERDVNWIDDETIVFASNRSGIFNLFEKNLTSGIERPLTNVLGGAFTPVFTNDTLFFTQYDADGFSLYKIAYNKFTPPQNDTTLSFTERQEVLKITDTLWTECPEVIADTTNVSLAVLAENTMPLCQRTAKLITRDSTITLIDTIKNVSTKEGSKEIQLYGKLKPREVRVTEFEKREFTGAEKDYKPIPVVPLFVPMLVFNENAPDLTVFGEGTLKTKAGLAVILADPLKKNTLQLGLLLELGKGFDYINTSGLNPEQEKEFFALWENKSTPLDLSLAYTYANYTSKDTVRYEDVRAHGGDSLGTSHYAIPMHRFMAGAGYSIFKSVDTLNVALSYDFADFNLYEDDFSWTYQKSLNALVALGLYGDHSEEGSGIDGKGNGMFLYYQYTNSDLYRPGTFAESFYVTESGSIKPKYRNFNIQQMGLHLYGSVKTPFLGATVAAGGKLAGIINWNTDAKEDTLDSYYYTPLFLEGYPYLRSSENYTLAGTKTAIAELHYLLPIYSDFRKSFWIFTLHDFYIDIFTQAGAAWNSKWFDMDLFKDHDFWDRSVGLTFRMANKIFYSIPFDISLSFARGLSRIGEDKNFENGRKLNPIDLPLLPQSISPTRIKFSIGMGFANSWM